MGRVAERALREITAVIAAWALVVHLLAMGLVPYAPAHGALTFDLCHTVHDAGDPRDGDAPGQGNRTPLCCILCGGPAVGPPPSGPAVVARAHAVIVVPIPVERGAEPHVERHERASVAPRAPPFLV